MPFSCGCLAPREGSEAHGKTFPRLGVKLTFPCQVLGTAAVTRDKAGYIIFQDPVQNESGGPLVQKRQKKVLLKVLKYKSFCLSSAVFSSTCHGVFICYFKLVA